MILSPVLGLRPVVGRLIAARNVRPSVKLSKDKFQISIDVKQFTQDELRVKARPEYVVIEGKQERKLKNGLVVRQFYRKFKLPDGCDTSKMQSVLSCDGILTIMAPRKVCEQNLPCETTIPICSTNEKPSDSNFVSGDSTPHNSDISSSTSSTRGNQENSSTPNNSKKSDN